MVDGGGWRVVGLGTGMGLGGTLRGFGQGDDRAVIHVAKAVSVVLQVVEVAAVVSPSLLLHIDHELILLEREVLFLQIVLLTNIS